ncbi:hypothetical protein FAF44_37645 [Nonomuraea sp. MG754425]|uniref:hypothetical protein n=1 Tax=Nonomuraea sp. MG754425 TaxID=2570319 RepID=UPI001F20AC3F|nr:hypothetical protein [Nonomuraea sp. MG754425]MCF6474067.1 hypothetical protein [Nonomuraea sp. MG754425]
MKQTIIGFAAGAALLLTATPAVAAPKDPLAALRAQLAAGKGVSFSFRMYGQSAPLTQTGRLQFGKKGIAASDVTGKLATVDDEKPADDFGGGADPSPSVTAMSKPERTIRIGRTSYVSGGPMSAGLPEGKKWYKQSPGWTSGVTALFGGFVNAADPSTLKVLLARSKRSGSTYKGSMSVKDLLKASEWSRATMWWKLDSGVKVSWTLAVGSSGLPVKLTTRLESKKIGVSKTAMEMRYTKWGAKVSIKAPAASTVTAKLDPEKAALRLPPAPKR